MVEIEKVLEVVVIMVQDQAELMVAMMGGWGMVGVVEKDYCYCSFLVLLCHLIYLVAFE